MIEVHSDEALRMEVEKIIAQGKGRMPRGKALRMTVRKKIEGMDAELVLGAKRDEEFGPVLLFGERERGGRTFKEVSVGLPPLNQVLAKRLMEETPFYRRMQEQKGESLSGLQELEHILVRFSDLITDLPEIEEMEIDPLVISRGRPCGLDARIVMDREGPEHRAPYSHLVITPYPARYVMPRSLTDGTPVLLRPIKPEDEPLVGEMLAAMSEQTLKERFFQILKSITHEMLTRICNIDYDREIQLVAEIKKDQKRQIIGMGSLMIESDFKRGEFSVLVHDSYQAKGVGRTVTEMLIRIGREKELEEIFGIVLPENVKMLRLAQTLGFTGTRLPEGIVRITLALRSSPPAR